VRVVGLDVDAPRVAAINRGVSHIPDVPSARLAPLVQSGRFRATTDYATCAAADGAVICVPTPFTKMKAPDLSYIEAACRALAPHMDYVVEHLEYPDHARRKCSGFCDAGAIFS
jgi:UDP-N-acetyl-D-glucosamine dehydrogenase